MDSDTVSTLESESELEAPRTIETNWTPESSPGREKLEKEVGVEIRALSMDSARGESVELSRVRTFGEKEVEVGVAVPTWGVVPNGHGRNSVGVAF
jgi:hypothetical protein